MFIYYFYFNSQTYQEKSESRLSVCILHDLNVVVFSFITFSLPEIHSSAG